MCACRSFHARSVRARFRGRLLPLQLLAQLFVLLLLSENFLLMLLRNLALLGKLSLVRGERSRVLFRQLSDFAVCCGHVFLRAFELFFLSQDLGF